MTEQFTTLIQGARRVRDDIENGQCQFSDGFLERHLLLPIEALEVAMTDRSGRWWTLKEAIRETGRNPKYFDRPLRSLGGRSRLEDWRDSGLAEQTEEGLWLIAPVALMKVEPVTPTTRSTHADLKPRPGEDDTITRMVEYFTQDRGDSR